MKILSIHLGHNATAALAEDGVIIGVLSQEKCDNIKNSAAFPVDAIHGLLSENDWKIEDIEEVVISGNEVYPSRAYDYLFEPKNRIMDSSPLLNAVKELRDGLAGRIFPWPFEALRKFRGEKLVTEGYAELEENLEALSLADRPRSHVEHHLCHARAAYHALQPSDSRESALIFTMDGSGDGLCATVTKVDENGQFERLAETPAYASLGGIYSNTTRFLGMKILEHEYKVMGLAPYAKGKYMLETYERVFKPAIWLSKSNPLIFESKVNASRFYNYLMETAVGERFDNMAAAVQHLTEELVTQWVRNAINATGIRRIFTGGGVFMNVKLNRLIQEMDEVEQAYFMPSCGDESNPIGACYDHAISKGTSTTPLTNLYLGISYSNEEIEGFIETRGLREKYSIEKHDDIEARIAGLLAERQIVARFAGRCEWGARSLGNRAILAHPSHMESFYTVNDYIKSRDFWMPFAPSILDSAATKYLRNYHPEATKAPYMITAYAATELGVEHLRAALHQGDHTLRPQVVETTMSPDYHRLIRLFEKKTGVGAVLNTSFNMHGYPLVATPEQALMTLEQSDLKYLALENYLLAKK